PAEGPARSSPTAGSRRTVLRGLGAVSVLGALGAGGHHLYRAVRPEVDPRTVIPLYWQTVAYGGDERRILVGASAPHHELAPSSRLTTAVPAPAELLRRARRFWDATAAWRARVGAAPPPLRRTRRCCGAAAASGARPRPGAPGAATIPRPRDRGGWPAWPNPRSRTCGCSPISCRRRWPPGPRTGGTCGRATPPSARWR